MDAVALEDFARLIKGDHHGGSCMEGAGTPKEEPQVEALGFAFSTTDADVQGTLPEAQTERAVAIGDEQTTTNANTVLGPSHP